MTIEPRDHIEVVANFADRIIAATSTAYSVVQPRVTLPDRSCPHVKVNLPGSPGTGTEPPVSSMLVSTTTPNTPTAEPIARPFSLPSQPCGQPKANPVAGPVRNAMAKRRETPVA